ncbi:branched chain amino acid aminotransferase [Trinickia symbiotica]|uniref:Branched-chain-amino-acid aminotransferase n=1 Tax=Trinickia symbiotica TaxID=863227 RepID=A0A2N7X1V3_9BURK|nr:branched-chain amino acid aminotransferase [Trinickia symbiotica]PMS35455.1 branched-chain amino acid aminotransferase [Trinickia symbiotica]PPK45481.1 branched chain amino acid aminotransferase [Trinickia symbiotica]
MTTAPNVPFDQREGTIWLDGRFVEWKSARIHVLTHGLHYASCVYEGERVYSGSVFRLRAHTDRLYRSAQMLDFAIPYAKEELEAATAELIERNEIVNGYVRPIAWRGSEQISTSARATRIHVALACWSWPSYFDPAAKEKGIALQTAKWRRPPPVSSPYEAKASSHYMIATLCKHQAEANGFHDALMLDWRGQIAEATSANIFFVRDGVLHTPTPDCFLDGITRRTVIDLARERGIEVVERPMFPDELDSFSECFLTGTAAEVCPVGRIDAHAYQPSTITFDLMGAYSERVNQVEGALAHE